jgi:hypothetical protein
MPESLEEVAAEWLHRPQRIQITAADASISKWITQVGAPSHILAAGCQPPLAGLECDMM